MQEINQARKQAESSAITEEADQETQDASHTTKHHSRGDSEQRLSNNDSTDNQVPQADPSSSMTFYATLPRTGSLASECSNMIMAEDMMANQAQSVSWVDPMAKPMQENENYMPQSSMPPQNCTCSAATGPCIGHMEKMRMELLGEIISPMQLHHEQPQPQQQQQQQQNPNNHVSDVNMTRLQSQSLSPIRNYSHSSSR